MRHRNKGRKLGRTSSHRKAMLQNLAASLFLTEREDDHPLYDKELDPTAPKKPKVKGRVVTTLQKAKEARRIVEKCITIARKSLDFEQTAQKFATDADRNTDAWKKWRKSDEWQKWAEARAPVVAAQRHALRLLGDREAVAILFGEVAPRFEDRPGGYTRVLKLATPRLGDAGARAVLEFVGVRDRVIQRSERPAFGDDEDDRAEPPAGRSEAADDDASDEPQADSGAEEEAAGESPSGEEPETTQS